MCVLISSTTLYETFLILRKIELDIIKNERTSCNIHVTLATFS